MLHMVMSLNRFPLHVPISIQFQYSLCSAQDTSVVFSVAPSTVGDQPVSAQCQTLPERMVWHVCQAEGVLHLQILC